MGVTVKKCHMIMSGNDCWNSVCFSCCWIYRIRTAKLQPIQRQEWSKHFKSGSHHTHLASLKSVGVHWMKHTQLIRVILPAFCEQCVTTTQLVKRYREICVYLSFIKKFTKLNRVCSQRIITRKDSKFGIYGLNVRSILCRGAVHIEAYVAYMILPFTKPSI